jgi:predicted nuclease of predicted toxin-antitoxin system
VKFLVDMALSPDLAIWLRSQGHDAVHAAELALNRAADTEILSMALDAGRVVISADLDFPRLLALAGATGPGLILLRSGNYSEAESLECVGRVLMSVSAEDLPRSIVVVDHRSVRRRSLPI